MATVGVRGSIITLAALVALVSGCSSRPQPGTLTEAVTEAATTPPSDLAALTGAYPKWRVVDVHKRSRSIFTQGLELLEDGTMLHSGGRYGESVLAIHDLDGRTLASRSLPPSQFGEGVTVHAGHAYQLTWREGAVHVYSLPDLTRVRTSVIDHEGWGACSDQNLLWVSDGTTLLRGYDTDTWQVVASIEVTRDEVPVANINELECVDDSIWANIWYTEEIIEIDSGTGEVVRTVDLSGITAATDVDDPTEEVLNGIAYDSGTDTWLVTGKSWPAIYRLELTQ